MLVRRFPAKCRQSPLLGYVPFKHDGSVEGKLRWLRIAVGWTQDDWAKAARVDPGTIGRWEDGRGLDGSQVIEAALDCLGLRIGELGLGSLIGQELGSLERVVFRRCK
jgi:DNA-binding XRE family transcriptional regulator